MMGQSDYWAAATEQLRRERNAAVEQNLRILDQLRDFARQIEQGDAARDRLRQALSTICDGFTAPETPSISAHCTNCGATVSNCACVISHGRRVLVVLEDQQ